jgi:DNA-binding transcriptional ArsR family regulator
VRADIVGLPSENKYDGHRTTTVVELRYPSYYSPMSTVERQAGLPQPAREEIRIEQVLAALGDPVRLLYVRELARTPAEGVPCGVIPLPVTKSTRTHHLRILREAGVISMRAEGTRRIACLRRDDLDALYPGLLDGILGAPH